MHQEHQSGYSNNFYYIDQEQNRQFRRISQSQIQQLQCDDQIENINIGDEKLDNAIQDLPLLQKNMEKARSYLQIGDIIYINYELNVSKKSNLKGRISGDGISRNNIEFLSRDSQYKKNANQCFRNCLFQIYPSLRYEYQTAYQKFQQMEEKQDDYLIQKDNKQRQKLKQELLKLVQIEELNNQKEFEDKKGQLVAYGQQIQFKHIFSGNYMMLNTQSNGLQNGSQKISIQENSNELTNFLIVPSNQLNQMGDLVLFNDKCIIQSFSDNSIFLHIAQENLNDANLEEKLNFGLEVNGYEHYSEFRIKKYQKHNHDSMIQSKNIDCFAVVYIKNRASNKYLRARQQFLNCYLSNTIKVFQDQNSSSFIQINQIQDYHKNTNDIEFVSFSEENTQIDKQCLWEIEKVQYNDGIIYKYYIKYNIITIKIGNVPTLNQEFRIKHLLSGQYLAKLQNDENKIVLAYKDAYDDSFYNYKFKIKDQFIKTKHILFDEQLYIMQSSNQDQNIENKYFVINNDFNDSDNENLKLILSKKRFDNQYSLFEIKMANEDIKVEGYKLNSIQQLLFDFYSFLNLFGYKKGSLNYDIDEKNLFYYDFYQAIAHEKKLNYFVDSFQVTLQKIKDILLIQNNPQDLQFIQNQLLQMMIFDLLMQIIKLIAKLSNFQQSENSNQKHAFQISSKYFTENVIVQAYEVLNLCIKNNPKGSHRIMEEFYKEDFIIKQYVLYPQILTPLMYESSSNNFDNENYITRWIDKLEAITDKNLENQTFYTDLISKLLLGFNDDQLHDNQLKYCELILKKTYILPIIDEDLTLQFADEMQEIFIFLKTVYRKIT